MLPFIIKGIRMENSSHPTEKLVQETAHGTSTWNQPIPFSEVEIEASPYPVNALPSILSNTIIEYQKYGQQPMALIACSALANVSLACQAIANVARDYHLQSPISLYFLVAALSGERKSVSDTLFSKATREWEENILKELHPKIELAKILHKKWEEDQDSLSASLKYVDSFFERRKIEEAIEKNIKNKPNIPLLPTIYFEDVTQEALAQMIGKGWPSASLWSDEGGIVMGSHSMNANPTKFVSLLNRLWDAKKYVTHRKTSEDFVIKDRRLTVNLMMQPILLRQMLHDANGIPRHSGFLPRCLIAHPKSLMGQRFYQEPKNIEACFSAYNRRIKDCLSQSTKFTASGCINLPVLKFSETAKKTWVKFFDYMESGLGQNGQWRMMTDFASKAGENAARLAALFHLFEGKDGEIDAENTEQALQIIQWHMHETRRLLSIETMIAPETDAQKLLNWLLNNSFDVISTREIQRNSPIRERARLDNALEILIEHQYIRLNRDGNKTLIYLNPYST